MARALITGSTGGLGQAIAAALASQGLEVWLGCQKRDERGLKLQARLREGGASAELVEFDVSCLESCEAALVPRLRDRGALSTVVYCAGVTRQSMLMTTPPAEWQRMIAINLTGFYNVCKLVLGGMMEQRSGSIVAISSVVARSGLEGQAPYAASKAALEGAVRLLARQVGECNVRVNAVRPGWIDAGMNEGKSPAPILERIPLQRVGTPQDVVDTVSFLCSSRASYVSGCAIPVTGGLDL